MSEHCPYSDRISTSKTGSGYPQIDADSRRFLGNEDYLRRPINAPNDPQRICDNRRQSADNLPGAKILCPKLRNNWKYP